MRIRRRCCGMTKSLAPGSWRRLPGKIFSPRMGVLARSGIGGNATRGYLDCKVSARAFTRRRLQCRAEECCQNWPPRWAPRSDVRHAILVPQIRAARRILAARSAESPSRLLKRRSATVISGRTRAALAPEHLFAPEPLDVGVHRYLGILPSRPAAVQRVHPLGTLDEVLQQGREQFDVAADVAVLETDATSAPEAQPLTRAAADRRPPSGRVNRRQSRSRRKRQPQ